MDRFLDLSTSAGELAAQDQEFTLSGERARQHLLASVPPNEQTVFKGLLFLGDALNHLGHQAPNMYGYTQEPPPNSWVHLGLQAPSGLIERGPDWIEERFQQPFTSKDPVDLTWDRAWIRLLAANQKIDIAVKDKSTGSNWSINLDPKKGLCPGSGIPFFQKGFYMAVGPFQMGLDAFNLRGQENRLRLGRRRPLKLSEHGGLWSEISDASLKGNWFDYRSRHVCLHERVVCSPIDSTGLSCALSRDYHNKAVLVEVSAQRQIERMRPSGFFARLWSNQGPKVLGRSWTEACHDQAHRPEDGTFSAKAIFGVALDERSATVDFFSDGHSLTTETFSEGPKGLVGVVHWPELQTDLWGQRFVENSEWEQALAWTRNQLTEVQSYLLADSSYLVAEVVGSHTRKAYRKEVENRIKKNWFNSESEQPAPSKNKQLGQSPEERAYAIRRRLNL